MLIKFWINARQYFIEQHKINYVRKHFKNVTYDVVVYRAQIDNVYFYVIFDEMFKNFEQVFEKRNEIFKKTSELFSINFFINFKNKNEIFNEFMIRFNSLTVSLKINDNIKINEFKKKITSTMRYRMKYKTQSIKKYLSFSLQKVYYLFELNQFWRKTSKFECNFFAHCTSINNHI